MPVNTLAVTLFLEGAEGPVARAIEDIAENVADIARENAAQIMHRNPDVVEQIDYEMSFASATVGIRPGANSSSIAIYLADKEERERPSPWLVSALEYQFAVLAGQPSISQVNL